MVVRAWPVTAAVRFHAEAFDDASRGVGIERMRFAFGVDHSLAEFHQRVQARPADRSDHPPHAMGAAASAAEPFEALRGRSPSS